MSKKKEKQEVPVQEAPAEEVLEEQSEEVETSESEPQADTPGQEPETSPEEAGPVQEATVPREQFLRLAAEYDNYRKRTAREKESLWTDAKADTVQAFLPVYDNLERALKQDTAS